LDSDNHTTENKKNEYAAAPPKKGLGYHPAGYGAEGTGLAVGLPYRRRDRYAPPGDLPRDAQKNRFPLNFPLTDTYFFE
jgi:hypothetical protein